MVTTRLHALNLAVAGAIGIMTVVRLATWEMPWGWGLAYGLFVAALLALVSAAHSILGYRVGKSKGLQEARAGMPVPAPWEEAQNVRLPGALNAPQAVEANRLDRGLKAVWDRLGVVQKTMQPLGDVARGVAGLVTDVQAVRARQSELAADLKSAKEAVREVRQEQTSEADGTRKALLRVEAGQTKLSDEVRNALAELERRARVDQRDVDRILESGAVEVGRLCREATALDGNFESSFARTRDLRARVNGFPRGEVFTKPVELHLKTLDAVQRIAQEASKASAEFRGADGGFEDARVAAQFLRDTAVRALQTNLALQSALGEIYRSHADETARFYEPTEPWTVLTLGMRRK